MPKTDVDRSIPCPLVNPLCPDDLCVLWAGHPGTSRREHLLGSMYGSADDIVHPKYRERMSAVMFLAPVGTTAEQLVELGCDKARELFGD